MILVIPRVRAAQLLRSRHLFSENITRGVPFLMKESSGGVTFQEKLVGWSYRHFAKIPWNMQRLCRVPAIPGARAAQLLRSRHPLFGKCQARGNFFEEKVTRRGSLPRRVGHFAEGKRGQKALVL